MKWQKRTITWSELGKQNVQAKKVYSGNSAFVACPKIPLFFSFKCLPCRLDHPCQFSSVVNSDLLRTTLAWAGILIFTYSSTVKPVLSRPLLSGHLPKFQKPFPLITAKLTHIMRSPVLSGHAHLFRGPSKLPVCFIAFTSIDLCQAATIAVRKQSFSNLLSQNSHRMTKAY